MPSSRQASSTATSALRVHSEYSVCSAVIGMHGVRLSKRRRRHLGQADRPDLSFLHEIREGADALFDRQPLVPAVQVVEVDDIGLQPLEALLAVLPDHLGSAVDLTLTLRVPEHAALGDEDELAPAAAEHVADERLVRAEAVQRRRVDVRVSEVERLQQDGGRRLLIGRRAVGVRQAHAAKTDGGGIEGTELASLH